jgi:hypothetical protein
LALLNSKLCWWYLVNTGTTLANGYFRFKPDYINTFPIPEYINPVAARVIENCVDYIHVLKDKSTPELSNYVKNEFMAKYFEDIIDGCIYEIYFEEHMKDREIDIVDEAYKLIEPISELTNEEEIQKTIHDMFFKIQTTDNKVRSRLELFVHKSPEYLKTIIQS